MKDVILSCRLLALLLLLTFVAPAMAAKKVPFGSTNHWLYSYGTTNGSNPGGTWYVPALNLRPTIPHYHLNLTLARAQMAALRASGQNAYTIFLPSADLSCEYTSCDDLVYDGVWGELVDHSWSAMRAQHRANLKLAVKDAIDQGFSRIYIRLSASGASAWPSWDEVKYSAAWNFIVDVHAAATEAVNEKGMSAALAAPRSLLMFDLGAETGGTTGGQIVPYVQRLWSDYSYVYGVDDTVGFSMIVTPGRFNVMRTALQATGAPMPKHWSITIYGSVATLLATLNSEMNDLRNQPVHIMEAYFNNSTVASDLATALSSNPLLNIESLNQWPLNSALDTHFSTSAIDDLSTTTTFTNYASLLASRKMYITSTNANLIGIQDSNCASTTSWPCSVTISWAAAPAGKMHGIYYNLPGGGTALVFCNSAAGSSITNWISLNPQYVFDLYEITGGSCNSPSPNAGAIKRATAESTPF